MNRPRRRRDAEEDAEERGDLVVRDEKLPHDPVGSLISLNVALIKDGITRIVNGLRD
jgi:hypothetical protein